MKRFLALTILIALSLACRLLAPVTITPTPVLASNETPPALTAETAKFDPAKLGSAEKDATYCTMGAVPLKMDVYYPETASAPWLLVIYIHGGGWQAGDKSEGAGFRNMVGCKRSVSWSPRSTTVLRRSINFRLRSRM